MPPTYRAMYDNHSLDVLAAVTICETSLPDPAQDEVLVAVEAAPINPADLLTIMGLYGELPTLPACPGDEGVGRIVSLGSEVVEFNVGERVLLPPGSGSWSTHTICAAADLIRIEADLPGPVLAILRVALGTAYQLWAMTPPLAKGEAILLNAGNSAVAKLYCQLASNHGAATISLVRSQAAAEEAVGAGATHSVDLNDTCTLDALMRDYHCKIGFDAVGGSAGETVAARLSNNAELVVYGAMSGENINIPPGQLVFNSLTVTGFWLSRWWAEAPREQRQTLVDGIVDDLVSGKLNAPHLASCPFSDFASGMASALEGGHKVVLDMTS